MKKYLFIIMLLLCSMLFVGCDEDKYVNEDNYTKFVMDFCQEQALWTIEEAEFLRSYNNAECNGLIVFKYDYKNVETIEDYLEYKKQSYMLNYATEEEFEADLNSGKIHITTPIILAKNEIEAKELYREQYKYLYEDSDYHYEISIEELSSTKICSTNSDKVIKTIQITYKYTSGSVFYRDKFNVEFDYTNKTCKIIGRFINIDGSYTHETSTQVLGYIK